MGNLAKSIFSLLLGWFPTVVSAIWSGINDPDGDNFFSWIGHHLILIIVILCVIGLSLDLLVYCIRWKPVTVWKSFFRRRKMRRTITQPAEETDYETETDTPYTDPGHMPLFASNRNDDTRAEHEYAYNREQSEKTHKANTPADTESYVIRPNGYGIPSGRVPYDSPYRRPAPAALNAEDENQDAGGNTQKNVEKVMGPRRRRIRVQELFGDAGEGNSQYEAPKPVIDRNEAYYSPVYPRNWKENGDNRG